jgi:exodeoxyribonuclease V alpha subunit
MLRFTAVGYELPRTKAVELELDGEWVESKYGYQLQVEQWQEIVPQTADGLLAYLGSGLIKGIGPKTAEDIVATFGPDTLNILDNEPEKLLQIRGITEGKLKDIEESYAESRVLRNLMSLLGPFKITPATALKIYQNFGPACVDILKKCPYDLCQISGFGFKRVDGIVRKTDNRLHSAERIKGAVLYTLEDARGKSGHLFLPSEDLVKETLLLLNAPIPIPEQRVRAEEVQETLQQMILHGAVVAYKQYLYSPRVFGQEDDTARMIAERLANISVAENIESALEAVRESLGITLSQKQEQAVRTAFQHGLTIITGSPGTGKTTVLKAIIEVFKNLHPKGKFALMAPTGRASGKHRRRRSTHAAQRTGTWHRGRSGRWRARSLCGCRPRHCGRVFYGGYVAGTAVLQTHQSAYAGRSCGRPEPAAQRGRRQRVLRADPQRNGACHGAGLDFPPVERRIDCLQCEVHQRG